MGGKGNEGEGVCGAWVRVGWLYTLCECIFCLVWILDSRDLPAFFAA